jgi:hypothetical protein
MLAYLYTRDENLASTSDKWTKLLSAVSRFVKMLEKSGSGSVEFSRDQATIITDIKRLLDSDENEELFDEAYEYGLFKIGFDTLGSGEAAILNQLTSLAGAIYEHEKNGRKNILLFIDEGDMLLHLKWQRKYLSLLDKRLGNLKEALDLESIQIIVATHSPLLASDVLRSSITRMKQTGKLPAFGAPIQSIINCSFGTPSIGQIAERVILRLQSSQQYSAHDLAVIEEIDDDFVRQYLKKPK